MELPVQHSAPETSDWIRRLGRMGLITKGVLYCLLGTLAFLAAFHFDGHSTEETDRGGVLRAVRDLPAGNLLLAAIALGLLCYCAWRGFQAFGNTEGKEKDAKGWAARLRYFFSGLTYAAVAVLAIRLLFSDSGKKDSQQALAQNLLDKPMGQALAYAAAAIFFVTGIYQFYYAFRGKYRKHAGAGSFKPGGRVLLLAGMIGYCARGAVWLLIGFLFGRAALHTRAAEAGDTSRAFNLLQQGDYGSWLLAAVGLGLVCYGLFNFIRARYDRLQGKTR
ncbi:DUF1206 domain-containing protein [Flaviaesturariibacter aridisoli]|uniref:DUF1206 domain-containing protein n=1 Tax=Flaviaesturariibacter aridisoli TaxID=2545761 RepID=A0A4R4E168_9BACT|nr:DUF1206 domain-containing protein [Flaviaesturariibacter aridisoli]TCZ68324.1 DUF1206 domain-containing protein [Flaviaesturariibacter aridisoli]